MGNAIQVRPVDDPPLDVRQRQSFPQPKSLAMPVPKVEKEMKQMDALESDVGLAGRIRTPRSILSPAKGQLNHPRLTMPGLNTIF
jgi:hypothetical protein